VNEARMVLAAFALGWVLGFVAGLLNKKEI
jgi:hypothetical protein